MDLSICNAGVPALLSKWTLPSPWTNTEALRLGQYALWPDRGAHAGCRAALLKDVVHPWHPFHRCHPCLCQAKLVRQASQLLLKGPGHSKAQLDAEICWNAWTVALRHFLAQIHIHNINRYHYVTTYAYDIQIYYLPLAVINHTYPMT